MSLRLVLLTNSGMENVSNKLYMVKLSQKMIQIQEICAGF